MPEFEFYLFNEAEINNGKYSAGYKFTSTENKEDLPGGYLDADGTAVPTARATTSTRHSINMPTCARRWCS